MKNKLYLILAFAFLMIMPISASAAVFSFSPNSGAFTSGETFSVDIYVDPANSEEITVAKLVSEFSESGLEVVSFKQADGWIALPVADSDVVDNANGFLIKVAGFPSKVTEKKLFGTVVFKAKSASTATFNAVDGSMMLDTSNTDRYVASSGAAFVISEPSTTPKVNQSNQVENQNNPSEEVGSNQEPKNDTVNQNNQTPQTTPHKDITTTPSESTGTSTLSDNSSVTNDTENNASTTTDNLADVVDNGSSELNLDSQKASAIGSDSLKSKWYYLVGVIFALAFIGLFFWRRK